MSASEVNRWERELVAKLVASRQKARERGAHRASDAYLAERARDLSHRYLDGQADPTSITWSSRQNTRWGSATAATGTIRISSRLRGAPAWVTDAVIFHELCHLVQANHGPAFRALEARLPEMDRAQAFLDGAAWALNTPAEGTGAAPEDHDVESSEGNQ